MNGKVLTFYLNGSLLGIDITVVKEINRNVEFTPVPQANNNIAGLFNMRGQVVTLMNLAKILGFEVEEQENKTSCIILKSRLGAGDYVGLLIDQPEDVIDIEEAWCEKPPANVGSIEGEFIKELVKLKDRLIIILDIEKIIQ